MTDGLDEKLKEQVRYYRARAPEYDAWADRSGAFDRGQRNHGWFAEKVRLSTALQDFAPAGKVLEIAGGTGQWTEHLVQHATSLTVVDAANEALELNALRLGPDAREVDYIRADVFSWDPPQRYDVVFFSYWLSHVPPEYFERFWGRIATCLAPGGRVFLIDNIATDQEHDLDPETPGGDGVSVLRPAPDGEVYRVWKVLWQPGELCGELARLGWSFNVYMTGTYFMWAEGTRRGEGR